MRGRRDQVRIFKGRGDGFGCHQPTDMGHVSQHVGLNVGTQLRVRREQREHTTLGFKFIRWGRKCFNKLYLVALE